MVVAIGIVGIEAIVVELQKQLCVLASYRRSVAVAVYGGSSSCYNGSCGGYNVSSCI